MEGLRLGSSIVSDRTAPADFTNGAIGAATAEIENTHPRIATQFMENTAVEAYFTTVE